jgi:hypothetical protein
VTDQRVYKPNFTKVERTPTGVRISGLSENDFIAAATGDIHVGIGPLPPADGAWRWTRAKQGTEWTAHVDGSEEHLQKGRLVLLVGVAETPPEGVHVWGEVLAIAGEDEPVLDGDDAPLSVPD